jgi:hypothetical protein
MGDAVLEVRAILRRSQQRPQCVDRLPDRSDQPHVDDRAPADLFAPDVDLHLAGALGIELRIGKVRTHLNSWCFRIESVTPLSESPGRP